MTSALRDAFAGLTADEQDEYDEFRNPRAYMELRTKEMAVWSPVGDYQEMKWNDKRSLPGGFTCLLPADDHYAEYFDGQPDEAVRPIVIRMPGDYTTLWFITKFTRTRKGLKKYYEIEAVGALEHLSWIRLWPCWWSVAEFQPIPFDFMLGPVATGCANSLTGNLIRLQAPLFSIPTGNLLKPETYNLIANALDPIMVNPRNKFFGDTTKWDSAAWRMDKALDAFNEICLANDVQITYQFFDPDVDEQPFPEFIHLDSPRLIIDFVERGNPVGWTGTIVDGFLRTGAELVSDALGAVFYPILGQDGYEKYLDAVDGMINNKPIAVYTTGQYSPVPEFAQTTHVSMASRITAGGKSPDWLNQALVSGSNVLLGLLGSAIGLPGLALGVLEGVVKNKLFAFHTAENLQRANAAGRWRFKEDFAESSSTGLNLNTFAAMKTQDYANRAYTSHTIVVQNGAPYFLGKDLNLGDLVGVEMPDGTVKIDFLEEIIYEDSRTARGQVTLQIGRSDDEKEPGSIALGKIRRLGNWLTRAVLSE